MQFGDAIAKAIEQGLEVSQYKVAGSPVTTNPGPSDVQRIPIDEVGEHYSAPPSRRMIDVCGCWDCPFEKCCHRYMAWSTPLALIAAGAFWITMAAISEVADSDERTALYVAGGASIAGGVVCFAKTLNNRYWLWPYD